MENVIIKKPFVLNLPDGSKKAFAAGEQVEGELAQHWFVLAHAGDEAEAAEALKGADSDGSDTALENATEAEAQQAGEATAENAGEAASDSAAADAQAIASDASEGKAASKKDAKGK